MSLFCLERSDKYHKYTQVLPTSGDKLKGNITPLMSLIRMTCPGNREVDSRIMMHLKDTVRNGLEIIVILLSVDKDFFLAFAYIFTLSNYLELHS